MTVILPAPAESFAWVPAPPPLAGVVLQCAPLAALAPHFFTTRALHLRGDTDEVRAEWTRIAAAIGVPPSSVHRMRQVHGCAAFTVRAPSEPARIEPPAPGGLLHAVVAQPVASPAPEADALVTDMRGVALVVQVADCVPLLIADARTGAVAAVHAGWRGTAASIAVATVRRLQQEYGSDPADLVAAIGPSIGACCYQVGPDVREAFARAGHAPASLDAWFTPETADDARAVTSDRLRLDTWAANRDQLIAAGVPRARVYVAALCTATHRTQFHSYRVEGPSTGRLLGVIRRSG